MLLNAGSTLTNKQAHYAAVAALGCIVCKNNGYPDTPATNHHIRDHTGAGRKSHWSEVIPLCPIHHQQGDGSDRFQGHVAYHVAPRTFEARYGTQRELLEQVRGLLNE